MQTFGFVENIRYINIIIKNNNLTFSRLCHSGKKFLYERKYYKIY